MMRKIAFPLFAAIMLAGCATKYDVITPELQASMLSDLQAGKMTLDCDLKCKIQWELQAPSIHAYDIAENWQTLAVRVMQVGYGSDLAYYYLGQAAQGLGYHPAAIAYYTESLIIANGPNAFAKCAAGRTGDSDPCQGVDIVSSIPIPILIQASRDAEEKEAAASEASAHTSAPKPHHYKKIVKTTTRPDWAAPPPPSSATATTAASNPDWSAPPPPASK